MGIDYTHSASPAQTLLDKSFSLEYQNYQQLQQLPEEKWKVQWLKHYNYDNHNKDNSLNRSMDSNSKISLLLTEKPVKNKKIK